MNNNSIFLESINYIISQSNSNPKYYIIIKLKSTVFYVFTNNNSNLFVLFFNWGRHHVSISTPYLFLFNIST